jgi:hypothetical protein
MQFPKMNKRDVEAMIRIHTSIAAAHQALRRSQYDGRAMLINLLENCDLLITELYNRCERKFLGDQAEVTPRAILNDQSGLTASVEVNGNLDPNRGGQERV